MNSKRPAGRPPMLLMAAAVQAVEAAGLFLAAVLAAVDASSGRSYSASSGTALTVLAFLAAAILAWVASGIARAKPWSRTPAVMTQVAGGAVAVFLLQAQRFDWGVPAVALAVAGLVGLLTPASFRALIRN
jgi:hypothetical protein